MFKKIKYTAKYRLIIALVMILFATFMYGAMYKIKFDPLNVEINNIEVNDGILEFDVDFDALPFSDKVCNVKVIEVDSTKYIGNIPIDYVYLDKTMINYRSNTVHHRVEGLEAHKVYRVIVEVFVEELSSRGFQSHPIIITETEPNPNYEMLVQEYNDMIDQLENTKNVTVRRVTIGAYGSNREMSEARVHEIKYSNDTFYHHGEGFFYRTKTLYYKDNGDNTAMAFWSSDEEEWFKGVVSSNPARYQFVNADFTDIYHVSKGINDNGEYYLAYLNWDAVYEMLVEEFEPYIIRDLASTKHTDLIKIPVSFYVEEGKIMLIDIDLSGVTSHYEDYFTWSAPMKMDKITLTFSDYDSTEVIIPEDIINSAINKE